MHTDSADASPRATPAAPPTPVEGPTSAAPGTPAAGLTAAAPTFAAGATSGALPTPGAEPRAERLSRWQIATFTAAHSGVSLLLAILGLRGLYRFGRLFGTVEWAINYPRRRRFAAGLQRILGRRPSAAERRRHALEWFRQNRCDKLFYLVFDRIPKDVARDLFTIENEHLLNAAVARGRGVYGALSHHGPHHVAGLLMAIRGHKVAGVRDRREGGLRRFVQDRFARLYPEFQQARIVYADSFPRDIFRCFQEGYILGSAMDVSRVRLAHQRVEEVKVFGEPRPFLTGPLSVALRCGAPVLQVFIVPGKDFRYSLRVLDGLVDPDATDDQDAAVARAIRIYAANVETHLRALPHLLTRV